MRRHQSESHISNIKVAALINIGFTLIEFIGGALTNSLAILADALHDLGDSMVLISSWKIEKLAAKKPDWKRTFGYRRLSLLAAFLNAVVLFGGSLIIMFQVIGRLISPQPVHAGGMIGIAVIGIIANTFGSLKLRRGEALNEKILSWHLLEDVLGWAGILLAGIAIHLTKAYILDPVITIAFTAFVLWGVWRNSKEMINVFLEGAPSQKSLPAIVEAIEGIDGVGRVYDIHLWSLDGKHHLASVKATIDRGALQDYSSLEHKIKEVFLRHRITHSTVELDEESSSARKEQEQDFLNQEG